LKIKSDDDRKVSENEIKSKESKIYSYNRILITSTTVMIKMSVCNKTNDVLIVDTFKNVICCVKMRKKYISRES